MRITGGHSRQYHIRMMQNKVTISFAHITITKPSPKSKIMYETLIYIYSI